MDVNTLTRRGVGCEQERLHSIVNGFKLTELAAFLEVGLYLVHEFS